MIFCIRTKAWNCFLSIFLENYGQLYVCRIIFLVKITMLVDVNSMFAQIKGYCQPCNFVMGHSYNFLHFTFKKRQQLRKVECGYPRKY